MRGRRICLRKSTFAQLDALRERLEAAYVIGSLNLPDDQAEHVSMDYVVRHLLRKFEDHSERRTRHRKSAKTCNTPRP